MNYKLKKAYLLLRAKGRRIELVCVYNFIYFCVLKK